MTDSPRPDASLALGRLDHGQRDAILERAAGVELLALAEHVGHRRVDQVTQPHERRAPDQIEHVVDGDGGHRGEARHHNISGRAPSLRLTDFGLDAPHRAMRGAATAGALPRCSATARPRGWMLEQQTSGAMATGRGGATNTTCQAIRLCALDCADDACVRTTASPGGTAAAQAAFQALYDCTKASAHAGTCTSPSDINCLCLAQCLQDPPCMAGDGGLRRGNRADIVCEDRCH